MDFFDRLGDSIVNVTQGAMEKGKDVTDVAKLQYELKTKENFCKTQYEEIGRRFYQERKDVIPEDYMDLFEEVEAANNRIRELKDMIAEKKGSTSCPKCGAVVSAKAAFCSECGTRLNDVFEEE